MNRSENGSVPRSKQERIDVVPDYDYLFAETTTKKGKKKNGFFGKIAKMNFCPLLFSSLLYIFQTAPVWLMPLVTADVIDAVTRAVGGAITAQQALKAVGIDALIITIAILQNEPVTLLRTVLTSCGARARASKAAWCGSCKAFPLPMRKIWKRAEFRRNF